MAPGEDRESGSGAARSGARGRGIRGLLVDTTPLKHSPEFARLWFGTSVSQIGAQMTIVAVGLHIFYVVVAGGPRIGDLLAGTIATAIALWAPALLGGLIIIALMLVLRRVYGGFQRYDAVHPTP